MYLFFDTRFDVVVTLFQFLYDPWHFNLDQSLEQEKFLLGCKHFQMQISVKLVSHYNSYPKFILNSFCF